MPRVISGLRWNPDVLDIIDYDHIMGLDEQNNDGITNRKDLDELTARFALKYGTPYSYGNSVEQLSGYLDQVDLLFCSKNTNGNYGIYGNYRNNYKKYKAFIELDAKWYDPENLRNITISTQEVSSQNGNSVIKGFVFLIPKTSNKLNVVVHNKNGTNNNFIDNEFKSLDTAFSSFDPVGRGVTQIFSIVFIILFSSKKPVGSSSFF